MKKLPIILTIATLVLINAGCRDVEEITPSTESEITVFYPSFESATDAGTKVYFDNRLNAKWTDKDEVSIFSSNTGNKKFVYNQVSKTLELKVTASSHVPLSGNYAIYPFNAANSISSAGMIITSFPAVQTYVASSVGDDANVMVAKSSSTTLTFKNACGYLKLQLTGSSTITSIKISGNNSEKIAGKMNVTPSETEEPLIAMSEDATTLVTLDCGAGVPLFSSPTDFYIAIPPTTFTGGFTIEINDSEGTVMTKTTTRSIQIQRNHILPMAAFAYTPTTGTNYDIMTKSALGAYSGSTALYEYSAGTDQIMRSTLLPTYNFALLNTVENRLLTINNIPVTIAVGNVFSVHVEKYQVSDDVPSGDIEVKVVKKDDVKYWLLDTASGKGFIIKK